MVLLIDNYDSFTYNLVDLIGQTGETLLVARNDRITLQEIDHIAPHGIVISPGPGTPDEAGICNDLISSLSHKIPILGVCLGHQCIGQVYGAKVVRAPYPVHGKPSNIHHEAESIFSGLPVPFTAARYHSLIIDTATIPESLKVTARTEDGLVMGVMHRDYPVNGVQFHPESILTEAGEQLIQNWLKSIKAFRENHYV